MWNIKDIIMYMGIKDLLDIIIVAYILYNLYLLIKETRGEQLTKGVIIFLVLVKIAELLQLHLLYWILKNAMTFGMIALMIVFQPELRRVLEHLGQTRFFMNNFGIKKTSLESMIDEIEAAATSLSRQKIGALVVFEKKTGINEVIQTGTRINGNVSRQLLINVFIPNTPLHDGAVVIREDKIVAAACFLPLTENKFLNKELGTRHRAALGISEKSDCISLVVSEETGAISIAESGKLYRDLSSSFLREYLIKNLGSQVEKSKIFKKKGD